MTSAEQWRARWAAFRRPIAEEKSRVLQERWASLPPELQTDNQIAVVRARLDSCVFKGAVKRNGAWEAVPMCSMNQQTWSEVYDERLRDPELIEATSLDMQKHALPEGGASARPVTFITAPP